MSANLTPDSVRAGLPPLTVKRRYRARNATKAGKRAATPRQLGVQRTSQRTGAMGRYKINDGAGGFIVCDGRDAIIASGVSLIAAIELVHEGCRLCYAGQNHTDDALRVKTNVDLSSRR